MTKSPVVLVGFRRQASALQVLERIRQYCPDQLIFVSDGPRHTVPGEPEEVEKTRAAILSAIDWQCDILKLFSPVNLGVRNRISSGLDIAFKEVDQAIILEDDCLPEPTFFRFCDELLQQWKHHSNVFSIGGSQFAPGGATSYSFSRHNHCWGWATWRRAWSKYDDHMLDWPKLREGNWLYTVLGNNIEATEYWRKRFDSVYAGKINSWAYRWRYSAFVHRGLSAVPNVNLVTNIGSGHGADNFQWEHDPLLNRRSMPIRFPLTHPTAPFPDDQLDVITHRIAYKESISVKVARKIHKLSPIRKLKGILVR